MKPEQAFEISERCKRLVKDRCAKYNLEFKGDTHFNHITNNLLNLTNCISRIIEIDCNYWHRKERMFLSYVGGLATYLKLLDCHDQYLQQEKTSIGCFPQFPSAPLDYVTCSKIALENIL